MIETTIIFTGGLLIWSIDLGVKAICETLREGLKNIAIVIHEKNE